MVVLYNPDHTVPRNLESYIVSVDCLYAVDNSDEPDESVLAEINKFENVIYVSLGGNLGIAAALNTGARMATEAGYEWLLTMDQDTRVVQDIVRIMGACLASYRKQDIGIISSRYTAKELYVEKKGRRFNEMMATITSGNLLNLQVYKKTGPFLEKLFIDQVDHEYCMRLRQNGYKVIQANLTMLDHHMGNKKKHIIGNSSHYNPIRRYFITRNRFYVAWMYRKRFPRFFWYESLAFLKELAIIVFFENNKLAKFRSIWLGFVDFKNNNFERRLSDLEPRQR